MPNTDRVRLFNRQPRHFSSYGAWGLIVMGAVIALMGLIPAALLLGGVISVEQLQPGRHVRSPHPFYSVFALMGFVMIYQGVMRYVRSPERRRRAHPGCPPWMTDYDWRAGGGTASRLSAGLWGVFGGVIFTACIAWIHWGLTVPGLKTPVPILAGLGFTYLLAAACMIQPVYRVLQYFKYGRSRISYSSFPLPLGEPITLRLEMPLGIKSDRIKVTLRLIEEYRQLVTGGRSERHVEDRIDQIYADQVEAPVDRLPSGGVSVTAGFELPSGDYATALDAERPRYWEVEFHAETPGIDFSITCLLPIFHAAGGAVQRMA